MHVSVAMATYNGGRFLGEQLESIANQSRPPDELVVSDDSSTDRTIAIIERFAADASFTVRVIRNQQRLGFIENFFRAARECQGDYLAFSDQDDVWHPDKLARCVAMLEEDSHVFLVVHAATVVDTALRPTGMLYPNIRRRSVLLPGMLPRSCFPGYAQVLRWGPLASLAGHPRPHQGPGPWPWVWAGEPMTHDGWSVVTAGALGRVALLPDRLAFYRRHNENFSDQGSATRTDQFRAAGTGRAAHDMYRIVANTSRDRARYLETLRPVAQTVVPSSSAPLERAVESYDRHAEVYERRATFVYLESKWFKRAFHIILNVLRGDYRPHIIGGLGVGSLARDCTLGMWQRTSGV